MNSFITELHNDELTKGFFKGGTQTQQSFLSKQFFDERIMNFSARSPDLTILHLFRFLIFKEYYCED